MGWSVRVKASSLISSFSPQQLIGGKLSLDQDARLQEKHTNEKEYTVFAREQDVAN
jgi:hypothetical protein